ncbi:MAG: carboxypeptidase regulatory-like domain-containing protein [Gemmatimonadaceae bacterium]
MSGYLRQSLLLVAACLSRLDAQTSATLIGSVRDTAGTGVPLARVTVDNVHVLTDSAGRFTFASLPAGSFMIAARRLGFEPESVQVQLVNGRADSVHFTLAILPGKLPGIVTDAEAEDRLRLADFYRHRDGGNGGYFFNRRELEAARVYRVSDIMRRVPGVRLIADQSGRLHLRMGRSLNCPPDIWIDGIRAEGMNVDDMSLQDVEALEIYRGPSGLPPEYNNRLGRPGCGTLVIWTRLPG